MQAVAELSFLLKGVVSVGAVGDHGRGLKGKLLFLEGPRNLLQMLVPGLVQGDQFALDQRYHLRVVVVSRGIASPEGLGLLRH